MAEQENQRQDLVERTVPEEEMVSPEVGRSYSTRSTYRIHRASYSSAIRTTRWGIMLTRPRPRFGSILWWSPHTTHPPLHPTKGPVGLESLKA